MLAATLFGSLIGAGLGMIGAVHNSRVQGQNYELSKESLELQRQQFKYQQEYDAWQKAFAESQDIFNRNITTEQLNLAKSPVSSVVNDASKVGINPLAALGQSVGSVSANPITPPSSNAHTGFSGGSVPIDTSLMSLISNIVTTGMNVNVEKDIAEKNQALRQQELDIIRENNQENIRVQDEGNTIKRIESNIHQQLANANDKMTSLEFEKFAHDKVKDIKTYLLDKARFEYSKNFSEREFAEKISQFNKKFDEQIREFNENIKTADKDRRERYITSFVSDATKLIGDIFFASGRR